MGLHKGQTNNKAGRPKGKSNKVTTSIREKIDLFLNDYWENMADDFKKLEPKEKLAFIEKLLQYALPKYQTIEYRSLSDEPKEDTEMQKLIRKYKELDNNMAN